MPIQNHVIAGFRDPDVRIIVVHYHVPVVPRRSLALGLRPPEEGRHSLGEDAWHEKHVGVLRIHYVLNILKKNY